MIKHRELTQSFKYAFEGVYFALKYNQNLRIHFVVGFLVVLASIYLGLSHVEMGLLGVMIVLVIASEMINTAMEEMVNLITNEHRMEAKIAKDVSAAMVLMTVLASIIVGVLIFSPYIF